MVSPTKVSKIKRANKRKKLGKKRKIKNRIHGTTPKFAIHLDKE